MPAQEPQDTVDLKMTVSHDEKSASPYHPDEEWVRSLSSEEFAKEQKKLLCKVRNSLVERRAHVVQIDLRLLPTLFILLILNYLDRNALA